MLKIVIIGYGEMYANIIQGCLNSNVKIVGVFYDELIKLSPLKLFLKNIFSLIRFCQDKRYLFFR